MAGMDKHLRVIIAATVCGLVILTGAGIWLSLAWPSNWDSMLGSLLLNIVASLFGVLVAVLVAIFVLERYLERRRREAEQQATEEKRRYQGRWQGYVHGGVSMLSAVVTHVCLFSAYGKNRYLEFLRVQGDTSHVPETIHDFIPWLVDSLHETRKERRKASSAVSEYGTGMGAADAACLNKVFEQEAPSELAYTTEDLTVLLHYLRLFDQQLRDQLFLVQPFMSERMGFALELARLSQSVRDVADLVERLLTLKMHRGEEASVSNLNKAIASRLCTMGYHAIGVVEIIWAGPDDMRWHVPNLGSESGDL